MDTLKDVDHYASAETFLTQGSRSSLVKHADQGILQFPVMISRKMDYSTALMVSKSLERNFASFIMIATSLSPSMTAGDSHEIGTYLRKFHQNTRKKYDSNDFITDMGKLAENFTDVYNDEDNNGLVVMGGICEGATGNIIKQNKDNQDSVLNHIRMDRLNDKFVPAQKELLIRDSNLASYVREGSVSDARSAIDRANARKNKPSSLPVLTPNNSPGNLNGEKSRRSTNITNSISGGTNRNRASYKHNDNISDRILRDNDVKKANELVPTTLHLRVNWLCKDGEHSSTNDFLVGVKSMLHPIDSDEMTDSIVNACKGKGKLFNLIKWTTGETSFVRDFLLNVGDIKTDVVKRSSGASHWWITLKRRRALSKIKNKLHLPSGILPNTTIVLTLDEAEFIKSEYGYDLLNPHYVDKIMEEYFLISFVIVDSASEICYFKFEGRPEYEIITFSGLERDTNNSKNMDAKDVIKLLNRM